MAERGTGELLFRVDENCARESRIELLALVETLMGAVASSKVTFKIDADASKKEIEAIVAQSQKRSAVYDVIANPVNVTVEVA